MFSQVGTSLFYVSSVVTILSSQLTITTFMFEVEISVRSSIAGRRRPLRQNHVGVCPFVGLSALFEL